MRIFRCADGEEVTLASAVGPACGEGWMEKPVAVVAFEEECGWGPHRRVVGVFIQEGSAVGVVEQAFASIQS